MRIMKLVIIGCGAGGATAAQFARKTSRDIEIEIFTNEKYPQYSKCALPFVLSKKISGFNEIIEFSEEWFSKNKIKLSMGAEVFDIDSQKKELKVKAESESSVQYDKLIIATGATPWMPSIEDAYSGDELRRGVFFLRTMDDAKGIEAATAESKKAAIVGAGLTGLELAEALKARGLDVTVYEFLQNPLLAIIDDDLADDVRKRFESTGVKIKCSTTVAKIAGDEKVESVVVKHKDGKEEVEKADFVVVTTGNRPNTKLAEKAGCELGTTRGVKINERCETSIPDIYAIGDCAEYRDFVTQAPLLSGTAPVALQEGIVAGTNASGGNAKLPPGILSSRVTEIFGLEIAAVGPVTYVIEKQGIKPIIGRFKGTNLPHYIKEKEPVLAKIIVSSEGKILGAQVLGPDAGLRVNMVASAMLGSLSLEDFAKLESAYAPSVSPVLDPLVVAAQGALLRIKRMR